MLARLSAPIALSDARPASDRLGQILTTLMLVALLTGGWFALDTVELHLPASLVQRCCLGSSPRPSFARPVRRAASVYPTLVGSGHGP